MNESMEHTANSSGMNQTQVVHTTPTYLGKTKRTFKSNLNAMVSTEAHIQTHMKAIVAPASIVSLYLSYNTLSAGPRVSTPMGQHILLKVGPMHFNILTTFH